MESDFVKIDDFLMSEANIPFAYRAKLPRNEEIPNSGLLKKYFEPLFGYESVPATNIYIHSTNHKFASQIAAKVIMGFISRRTVCYCAVTTLVKGMVERDGRNEAVSGWDLLANPRVLGLFNFGQEPTNDFGKSITAITLVMAHRWTVGLPTVFSSDVEPSQLLSEGHRFPKPLADLILDDCLIVDVNSN